jgi:hypothetical protein
MGVDHSITLGLNLSFPKRCPLSGRCCDGEIKAQCGTPRCGNSPKCSSEGIADGIGENPQPFIGEVPPQK